MPPGEPRLPTAGVVIEAIRHDTDSRVLVYMLAAQAACYVASPYFNPYMLGQLRLSYVHYLILICIPYVARVVCLPLWGRVVDRMGPRRVLWLSGLLVAPLPAMWILSDSLAALIAIQIFAGLTWAGYELAQLLLFFDTIPTERRVGVLTVYNLFNAVAIFGGSILGAVLLAELGGGRNAYWTLFLVSSITRVAAVVVLFRLPAWAARPRPVATAAMLVPRALPQSQELLGIRMDAAYAPPGQSPVPVPMTLKSYRPREHQTGATDLVGGCTRVFKGMNPEDYVQVRPRVGGWHRAARRSPRDQSIRFTSTYRTPKMAAPFVRFASRRPGPRAAERRERRTRPHRA